VLSHSWLQSKGRQNVRQTYTIEELSSQPQVVVQSEERHSLQPYHDDLETGNQEATGMGLVFSHTLSFI